MTRTIGHDLIPARVVPTSREELRVDDEQGTLEPVFPSPYLPHEPGEAGQ